MKGLVTIVCVPAAWWSLVHLIHKHVVSKVGTRLVDDF